MKKLLVTLLFYMAGITAFSQYGAQGAEPEPSGPEFRNYPSPTDIRYTLQECLQMGLENNYDIRIARNLQLISDNNVTLGNAGYLPTVDVSGSYAGTLNNNDQFPAEGDVGHYRNLANNNLNAGVNLGWTVFNGFAVRTTYRRLRQLEQSGQLATRLEIEDFISSFTSGYYQYIRQYSRLKNLQYAVELSKERVRIVEARYEIGATSRLDLQQANVDLNTDRSQLIKQYEVLHNLFTELNRLLAVDSVDKPLLVADSVIVYDPGLDRDRVWERAREQNIFLLLAGNRERISDLDLDLVRSQSYPYLRFSAGYGYTGNWYDRQTLSRQNTYGLNYGLTFGIPIFDGMNQRQRIRNARIELDNSALDYQRTELALRTDLSNAWMAYRNNMDLVELEKSNLGTARDNHEIAIERYKLGQLSGIELREAQTSLLEAEERLVQAQYDTKLCEITLRQIAGEIFVYLE